MRDSAISQDELEALELLRAYRALDNPVRLRAYTLIHDAPGQSFNDITKKLGVESGLAAYHIGVLKAAGLIGVTYVRNGRDTSAYRLTAWGVELHSTLFAPERSKSKKPGTVRSRAAAAR